ncbi:Origin recognition complex subunit 3-like, partial [Homarus americanus]
LSGNWRELLTTTTADSLPLVMAATVSVSKDLQDSIHAKVFQDLVEFIRDAGMRSNIMIDGIKSKEGQSDIPTACLVTGVNMPDHDAIFGSLVRLLVDGVTPHIAKLQSRDCNTVRGAIFKMISQLMGQNGFVDPEFEDEIITGPSIKRAQFTMAVLTSWYKEIISAEDTRESTSKSHGSPRKRAGCSHKDMGSPYKPVGSPYKPVGSPRKTMGSPRKPMGSPRMPKGSPRKPMGFQSRDMKSVKDFGSPEKRMRLNDEPRLPRGGYHPPLVVILEDVENFPANVLHDLILICSEHRCNLPIVFVFGVATTSNAVHRSLSQDASACVAMETFQAQPSTHYLNHVIEKVLMTEKVPFHIGGRPFKLLLDIFLYSDLSVKNFVKGLKLCMMEHFLGNSSTFLCCSAPERALRIRAMTPAQLDIIRKLPSFRSYVENRPPKEQAVLLLDEKVTKSTVRTLMTELDSWYLRFCCLVKVVSALTSSLPHSPLGRQIREVLATCLSRPLVESEEFKEAQKMLKLMAREELLPILANILEILKEQSGQDEELSELYNELAIMLGRLNSLDQLDQVIKDSPADEAQLSFQSSDRFHLKEKLLEMAKKKSKKPNAYESLRSELLQVLVNTFEQHLQLLNKQPLHEVLFFDSSSVVKRHLVGMPRAALTTALSNPHHYLQVGTPANTASRLKLSYGIKENFSGRLRSKIQCSLGEYRYKSETVNSTPAELKAQDFQ